MKRVLKMSAAFVLLMTSVWAQKTEVIDRLVAIVNSTPILQSDWEVALRCEAMMDGRTPEELSQAEQRDVFNRLVDQELVREQMRGFAITPVTDADVDARITEIRSQIPSVKTDAEWKQLLERDGIAERDVRERVRSQLEILRFLDARMRPLVRVEYRAISQYYREHYLPELQKRGAPTVPLSEVSDKIREIITQQRMDDQITAWLQTLREGADIRFPKPATNNGVEATQSKQ